jgi:hypothetical protein
MADLVPVATPVAHRAPSITALDAGAPTLNELLSFMTEAELRVETLRMHIRDTTVNARGEETEWVELALRHPGHARVTTRRSEDPLGRDYTVWVSDGHVVRTYSADANRASVRPLRWGVVGAERKDLPAFSRLSMPRTQLPAESIVDAFVHPYRYARTVLATGPMALAGSTTIAGREAFVVRGDHPRSAFVLTDRPDHWIEIAVDRATGFLLLHVEHVGDHVSHHAEVTQLELDPALGDDVFELHLSADVRMLY